jgi:hypothetical protein
LADGLIIADTQSFLMNISPQSRSEEPQRRAQSAPLGLLLVISMVILGSTLVVVIGGAALSDTEGELDVQRSEKALTQFDSKAAMVALGSSGTQRVDLPRTRGGRYNIDEDEGWMNVSYVNTSSQEVTTVYNTSMGGVTYRAPDGTRVAYQGGGVWRSDGSGRSVMISPPEFHYRGATLTLPMIKVNSDGSVGDRATIAHSNTTQYFPNENLNENFRNPVDNARVNVTVRSEYYRAWGKYFAERTDGDVSYDHSRNTVTATLVTPVGDRRIRDAVQASSPAGVIKFKGSTSPGVDAYNSSDGDGYAGEGSANGWNNASVNTAGDVEIQDNGVEVYGNITSGGSVTLKDWSKNFYGSRVRYADTYSPKPAPAGVEVEQISGIDGVSPIDGYINRRVNDIRADSDSGYYSGDTITSGGTLGSDPGSQQYYVEHIDLGSGETLTIDTTDGDVAIAVRDYIHLNQATIEVDGQHEARFFIKGENAFGTRTIKGEDTTTHFDVYGGDVVTANQAENATQVSFYGSSHVNTTVSKNSNEPEVTGIIYAPSFSSNKFVIRQGEVYGGVVASSVDIWQDGTIHYDKSLQNQRAVPEDVSIVRITYLHISTNEINVTSG